MDKLRLFLFSSIISLALISILSTSAFASTSVYSGFVTDGAEFTADGVTYKVVSTGEDLNFILQSKLGTVVIYNGTHCEYASKYQYCMDDYKFSLGGKTRMNGKDLESYSLKINSVYQNADMSVIYRTADKTSLFVNEVTNVKIRVKNIGGATATNVDYKEVFPENAYTTSQYPIAYRKLSWKGSMAFDEEKDFEYSIYFSGNGTFTIPLTITYFNGVEAKTTTNSLVFTVSNEYDVSIQGKASFEINEIGKLNISISGNPKGIIYSEFYLPAQFQFVNTTFERHFGVNSWEGNISNNPKTFTIQFTSEQDVEKEAYVSTNYVSGNTKIKAPFMIKFTHKNPSVDYVIKSNKLSVYVKNPNRYSTMTDVNVNLIGGYSRVLRIPILKPNEDMLVLTDDLTKNIDSPITAEVKYQINGNEYSVLINDSDKNRTSNFNTSMITNPIRQTQVGSNQENQNQTEININNNNADNNASGPTNTASEASEQITGENDQTEISPENTADNAAAKKDDRGIVEKFFTWLNSIF